MKFGFIAIVFFISACVSQFSVKKKECFLGIRHSGVIEDSAAWVHFTKFIQVNCYPQIENLKTLDVQIYSGHSEIVFSSTDTSEKWLCDGNCTSGLKPGTYFSIVHFTTYDDTTVREFKDQLTLIIK